MSVATRVAHRRLRAIGWVTAIAGLVTLVGCFGCDGAVAETRATEPVGEANDKLVPARVIAVGDVHGDLKATRAVLRMAKLIDEKDDWIGGKSVLVQTGDQLDRGDGEQAILVLFKRLMTQSAKKGGRVVILNGNHEIMNVQGDFRYVTAGGFEDFANASPKSPLAATSPQRLRRRAEAFLPGGQFALMLAEQDVIAIVGDSVFVHGGVLMPHVEYGIERINRQVQAWMKGKGSLPEIVASSQGPIWARNYSQEPVGFAACQQLAQVLKALKVRRMVVGHTVHKEGITSACGDTVYRIDVGLAAYYGDNPVHALEITPAAVRVLKGAPRANPRAGG